MISITKMEAMGLTVAQIKTVSALCEVEGWANSKALSDHGGFPVSANKLVELGLAARRDVVNRTALYPFPVAEWILLKEYS